MAIPLRPIGGIPLPVTAPPPAPAAPSVAGDPARTPTGTLFPKARSSYMASLFAAPTGQPAGGLWEQIQTLIGGLPQPAARGTLPAGNPYPFRRGPNGTRVRIPTAPSAAPATAPVLAQYAVPERGAVPAQPIQNWSIAPPQLAEYPLLSRLVEKGVNPLVPPPNYTLDGGI